MNLILAIIWLLGAIGLFAYDYISGETRFYIRGLGISSGWFLLLMSAYNFARWYGSRMNTGESNALRIAHEARLQAVRHRERPEPDPTFDFSREEPSEKVRPPAEGPPSNN